MSERIRKPVKPKPASRWPGLRYAVSSSEWTIDSRLTKNAAYAGPHLLVIAHSTRHLSSPGKASAIAVEQLRRLEVPAGPPDLAAGLERGIEGLRQTFRELLAGNRDWAGNVTELTAMLWRGADAAIAHIGSTRAYMLRGGELTQLTRDHTLGQLLIEAGEITPGELGSDSRHSDVITRWLDAEPGEPPDIILHEAAAGDRYLLCTSTDRVMPPRAFRGVLREILQEEKDPQDAADTIAAMAFPAEQHDSLTCIVADV